MNSNELRAAAALTTALDGVVADPHSIVADLELTKFVNDAGEVDRESVERVRLQFENLSTAARSPRPRADLRQGNRGRAVDTGQLKREDLAHMSPNEINDARIAGRLDELLGISR